MFYRNSLFPQLNANYYWTSDANAEVDFLFSDGLYAYPLEAKAGNNVHAKSLKVYDKEYNPQLLFCTSLLPYEKKWEVSKHPSVFAVCSAQSTYFVKQAIVSVHSFSLFFTYNSNFYQRAFTVDYQSITKSQFSVYKELRVCQQEVNSLSTNS